MWYADDSAAASDISSSENGSQYGFHPNNRKTWLLVKPEFEKDDLAMFEGLAIK